MEPCKQKAKSNLVIATYNLQFSLHPDEIEENVVKLVKSGVMILCFQEVVTYPGGSFIIDKIIKRLGGQWQVVCNLGSEKSIRGLGNCIIWNSKALHLQSCEKMILPFSNVLKPHEKLFSKLAGGISVPLERRIVSACFVFEETSIRVTNVHLDHNGGTKNRIRQLNFLVKALNLNPHSHEIICGDFNNLDPLNNGKERTQYRQILGSSFTEATGQIDWTADLYNLDTSAGFKLLQQIVKLARLHVRKKLDYIWVKNISVSSCKTFQLVGSDHLPVVANLFCNQ